jgi:PKD repeat protein
MKLQQKISAIIIVILITSNFTAQNEFSKWYFGYNAGLDFTTSPPTILTNGALYSPEGVATISDGSGNLLFYTDGLTIYNNTHVPMSNGTGLFSNTSMTQAGMIVKQPGNSNLYYVFTVLVGQNVNSGARYSVVDMNLAAGMGSVTIKNVLLYAPTCEKQVAVRHCNGKDAWIISHEWNSNKFRAYLLNTAGIAANPVVSTIGETPSGNNGYQVMGQLKISPDGRKLSMATATSSIPSSLGDGGFHLFDFDASSGLISNSLTLLTAANIDAGFGAYGLEFSQDGTKLYGTTIPIFAPLSGALYQWNICSPTSSAIVSSQFSMTIPSLGLGSLQRAINDKIYLSTLSNSLQSISVINTPNASGAGMGLVLNGQSVSPKTPQLGLPNFINPYTRPTPAPISNTLACQNATFAVPPVPTFSSGCSATPYAPSGYLWNFGDAASGAANTSSLTNPVHTFSTLGTYSVSLILYNNCTNDTLKKVITVSTVGPTLSVAGSSIICKGAKANYTASGGSTYNWSNNASTATVTLTPSVTTVYSVSATTNGCSVSKQFTVTVSPCTGIASTNSADVLFSMFPSPVKNTLNIEAPTPAQIKMYDLTGKIILSTNCVEGHNEINMAELKLGLYIIEASSSFGLWRGRVVKVE